MNLPDQLRLFAQTNSIQSACDTSSPLSRSQWESMPVGRVLDEYTYGSKRVIYV